MAEVPTNRYGRLNRWSASRASQYNPGGLFSIYRENGTPRNNNNNNNRIDYREFITHTGIFISPQEYLVMNPDEIQRLYNQAQPAAAAMPPQPPVAQTLRRSARLAPPPRPIALWSPDQRCDGETCPITLETISGNGIKLSDGCYSAEGILHWYSSQRGTEKTTPKRNPYTERDKRKIKAYQRFAQSHLELHINATNSPYELSPTENFTRRRKNTAKKLLELQKHIKSRRYKNNKGKSKRSSSSSYSSKSKRKRG
jgi:hypothetical protein